MKRVLLIRSAAERTLVIACLFAVLVAPRSAHAQARDGASAAEPRVNANAAAQVEFQARLQKYVELRQQLASKLKPLSPTANAADLAARQESLAAAVRTARRDAKPGDLIPPTVATQIRRAIAADLQQRQPATRSAVLDEVPVLVEPAINKTLPDSVTLATIPPLLLNNLPRLPGTLQYRFIGRHIVLLDGDTRLMLDYILKVLPKH